MSWTPTPLVDGAPSLKFTVPDDVEAHTAIYTKMSYRIFTEDTVWNAWTNWINDSTKNASTDMVEAASKFSPYAL